MTSIGETKTVVLVLLCLLFATATSCTESDELSSFEFDGAGMGADMGANSAKAGVAWASLDKDVRDEFSNEFHHRRDRRALYDEYVEIIGGAAILDYLESIDPNCHNKAHALGNAIFAQKRDINQSLSICGNRCTNACMHGVVKEAFGSHKSEDLRNMMNDFCSQGEMGRLHKPGNCAHGIGHALMLLSDHNISESLDGCKGFIEPGMNYYCATGIFMEYGDMLNVSKRLGKPVTRPSLQYPCDVYTEYPAACYRYMIWQIEQETNASRSSLIEMCLGLPDGIRAGCFHGIGATYMRRIANDPVMFLELCSRGDSTDQILCVEGAIEKMADFNQAHAMSVCDVLSGENLAVCQAGAEEKMYRIDKPTMRLYRNQQFDGHTIVQRNSRIGEDKHKHKH